MSHSFTGYCVHYINTINGHHSLAHHARHARQHLQVLRHTLLLSNKTRRLRILALDDIFLSTLHDLGEFLAGLLVVLEQVIHHQAFRGFAHPLEEGEVLEFVCQEICQQ